MVEHGSKSGIEEMFSAAAITGIILDMSIQLQRVGDTRHSVAVILKTRPLRRSCYRVHHAVELGIATQLLKREDT